MSFSLFASVLCTALPSATPLEFPALAQDGRVAVQAGVHVTPTHLVARNYSNVPQLFVFVDARNDQRSLRALGAGASFEFDYPREALETVRLEVLTSDLGVWSFTGVLDLSGALQSGEQTFWIQNRAGRATTWLQNGAELVELSPDTTVLPDVWRANVDANLAAPACAPTHVPVVTPSNRPKGDAPPKLERRPLPPV